MPFNVKVSLSLLAVNLPCRCWYCSNHQGHIAAAAAGDSPCTVWQRSHKFQAPASAGGLQFTSPASQSVSPSWSPGQGPCYCPPNALDIRPRLPEPRN